MSKVQPRRLGRGLSSLMSISDFPIEAEVAPPQDSTKGAETQALVADPPTAPMRETNPTELPVDQISPNPHQPRKQMDDASIAELAASLKSTGMIQPVIVRRATNGYQ